MRADGEDITVTQLGEEVAGKIAEGEDRRTLDGIGRYKEAFSDLTVDEILAYAYSLYPDMATGSPTYGRIMSSKERHTVSMLAKGKIAPGHAAETLDRAVEDVWKMAGRMRAQAGQ